MRNIFFTSDTHFGHKKVIQYSNRPFASVEEMDYKMIQNINAKVPPDGFLYHLGDFCFGDEKRAQSILSQIHCKVLFLDGNHDKPMRKGVVRALLHPLQIFKNFIRVAVMNGVTMEQVPCLELKVKDPEAPRGEQLIVLCHYPMITWNKAHYGSWMLHGHSHGSLRFPFPARIMDVGVDPQNFFPVSYEEVKAHMATVKPQFLDHHTGD